MMAPTFSFVATSRNDDHGGDVLRRTQSFINRLAEQCARHRVPAELVLVEWNPPQGRAPLAHVLAWPAGSEWFSARIVTFPPELHHRLKHARRLSMYQMIAKNVGIRRALGDYIIATNIDIIFSDALFAWLKAGALRPGVLYRSDRWDIPNEIQLEQDFDRLLRRAREEAIRKNFKDGTYVRRSDGWVNTYGLRFDHAVFFPLQRLFDRLKKDFANDPSFSRETALQALDEARDKDLPLIRREYQIPVLPTNGCGDFTMMAAQDWSALRGYPEWPIFSWAIDSIIVYQAHYNAIVVEDLPADAIHYHIEHDYGSGWTPEGATNLWSRLDQRGIPYLKYTEFNELVFGMQDNAEKGVPTLYNGPDWGFVDDALPEHALVGLGTPPQAALAVNGARVDEDFLGQLVAVEASISLASAEVAGSGIRAEHGTGKNGQPEIAVETLAQTWSYSLVFDLSPVAHLAGEYWMRFDLIVDEGNVAAGVLNVKQDNFLTQAACGGAGPTVQQIYAHIPDLPSASRVVIRNINPENHPSRYRIGAVQLLREPDSWHRDPASAATDKAGRDASSSSAANGKSVTMSRLLGTGDAIVRVLRGDPSAEAHGDDQVMIVFPTGKKNAMAVLDLPVNGKPVRKVVMQLHVLEGEASIGLQRRAGEETMGEQRVPAGQALTRIELTAVDGAEIGRLVIRNAASDASKLLLHRAQFEAPST